MQACRDRDEVLMLIQKELVVQNSDLVKTLSKVIPVSTWAEQGKAVGWAFKKRE